MAQMKAYIMPMKKITLICNLVHLPKEFQNWVVCQIMERLSNSCLKIKVGMYANGEPKYEMQHLSNCKAVSLGSDITPAQRPLVGRKKLNPEARKFVAQEQREIPPKVQMNKNWCSTKDNRDLKAPNRPQRQRRQPNRYIA